MQSSLAAIVPLTDEAESQSKRLGEVARKRWHERFENWALWKEGSVGYFGASVVSEASERSLCNGDDVPDARFQRFYEPTLPMAIVGEAIDTDRLVGRLDGELRMAVHATYRRTGTLEYRAGELHVTPRCLRNRVAAAMFECEQMWQARPRYLA